MESFTSYQHRPGQTDRQTWGAQGSWPAGGPWCFVSVMLSTAGRHHCLVAGPLPAAVFDSISDTHAEHGLSLEKLQHLILSRWTVHAQPATGRPDVLGDWLSVISGPTASKTACWARVQMGFSRSRKGIGREGVLPAQPDWDSAGQRRASDGSDFQGDVLPASLLWSRLEGVAPTVSET